MGRGTVGVSNPIRDTLVPAKTQNSDAPLGVRKADTKEGIKQNAMKRVGKAPHRGTPKRALRRQQKRP